MRHPLVALILTLAAPAAAADDVSDAVLERFNTVVREAESLSKAKGPAAAITHYEQALLGDLAGYGRVSLRLGQLYQQQKDYAKAAAHYRDCDADERVDPLDRELVCQTGLKATTATIILDGLPLGGQVVVLQPAPFAGPLTSGRPVPLGELVVVVDAPDREPRESTIRVSGPMRWTAALGLRRGRAVVPSGFVPDRDDPPPPPPAPALRWPAYVTAGVGAGLIGGGFALGLSNRADLEAIRDRQRGGDCPGRCATELSDAESNALLADGMWIGGAALVAGAVALWFIFDEAGPSAERAPEVEADDVDEEADEAAEEVP